MQKTYHKQPKTKLICLIGVALLLLSCTPNKKEADNPTENAVNTPQADTDWEALQKALPMFKDREAYEAYKELPPLGLKYYEDTHAQQKSQLALDFWDRYPTDSRRDTARGIFLSGSPYFIPKDLTDSVRQELANIPRKEWPRFMRALPLEVGAMQQWIQKGNAMVAEVTESNRPVEDREAAEWSLFARDFKMAARYFSLLAPKATRTTERNYWDFVDAQYWASFKLRLQGHIEKYANLPIVAERAKDFLSALKPYAPKVAENGWRELFQEYAHATGEGEKALYGTAGEQLEALETESGGKELEIKFTALDGREIDLRAMRGKVVLVDFWATWCAPCVKEVPHLKEMYKKYHGRGFEIIGITMDEKKAEARVRELVTEKGIPWPQRFEGKGFDGDSYRQLYGIGSLPTVWLVNKEGTIVDRNARGERLEPLIRKHLGLN